MLQSYHYIRRRKSVTEKPEQRSEDVSIEQHGRNGSETGSSRLRHWAAGLAISAIAAHALAAPDHFKEWWGFSAFFVIIGTFQLFYGFALLAQPWRYDDSGDLRPDADNHGRPYYLLGVTLSGLLLLAYVVSRTTGLPFFGTDAVAQPVSLLGLAPVVQNIPLFLCLILLLRRNKTSA
jgi:hypothetical protein